MTDDPPKPSVPREPTRLQAWLDRNGYTSAQLEAASGIARPSMRRIRKGSAVTQRTMLRILQGARMLARRRVNILELFDLDSD
jgi:hypothetical protein